MAGTVTVPPGATIEAQLDFIGMSPAKFAARMGLSESEAESLIRGEADITPDVARRLERVLGIPAHFWMNLEAAYRFKISRNMAA